MINIKPGIYKHYKGNKYHVLGVAKHSETLAEFVVYEPLYDNPESMLWIRPVELFTDEVEWEGKKVPHFRLTNSEH